MDGGGEEEGGEGDGGRRGWEWLWRVTGSVRRAGTPSCLSAIAELVSYLKYAITPFVSVVDGGWNHV